MPDISLTHLGKIDLVGTVQVFGASFRPAERALEDLVYLSYAGPPTAADAVWAALVERRALDFTDLRGRPRRLRHGGLPGLEGKQAPWRRFTARLDALAIDHCILLDRRFSEPAYDLDAGLAFAFELPNLPEKLGHHVARCVDVAVFPHWHAALLALGQRERLVRPLSNLGHPVWQISLDRTRWTALISAGVSSGELSWPR